MKTAVLTPGTLSVSGLYLEAVAFGKALSLSRGDRTTKRTPIQSRPDHIISMSYHMMAPIVSAVFPCRLSSMVVPTIDAI
jgi:hypothetical protein